MQPNVVVNRPELLPSSTGGVPVNAVIGGFVFPGGNRPVRKLPEKPQRTVNEPGRRTNKGW